MKCPKCAAKLPISIAREKFACPQCGAQLIYPVQRFLFLSLAFAGVPWLALEASIFHFESMGLSFALILASSVVVAGIAAQIVKPKLAENGRDGPTQRS